MPFTRPLLIIIELSDIEQYELQEKLSKFVKGWHREKEF